MEKVINKEGNIHENVSVINSSFSDYVEIGPYSTLENVTMGNYSYCGEYCILQNVEIKNMVNIAAMVRIGAPQHPMNRPTLHHFTYRRRMYGFDCVDDDEFFQARRDNKVIVGNDVWIGHGAIIREGITIGDGAIIGSGAVVTKDVGDYEIVGGVPAKRIRYRFSEETINKLKNIKFWNWSYEKIKKNFKDFLLDAEEFADKYYKESCQDEGND